MLMFTAPSSIESNMIIISFCRFINSLSSSSCSGSFDSLSCMWANINRKPPTASHRRLWAKVSWLPWHGPCKASPVGKELHHGKVPLQSAQTGHLPQRCGWDKGLEIALVCSLTRVVVNLTCLNISDENRCFQIALLYCYSCEKVDHCWAINLHTTRNFHRSHFSQPTPSQRSNYRLNKPERIQDKEVDKYLDVLSEGCKQLLANFDGSYKVELSSIIDSVLARIVPVEVHHRLLDAQQVIYSADY